MKRRLTAIDLCVETLKRGSHLRFKNCSWRGSVWEASLGDRWHGRQLRTFSNHTIARVLAMGLARRIGDRIVGIAPAANDNLSRASVP